MWRIKVFNFKMNCFLRNLHFHRSLIFKFRLILRDWNDECIYKYITRYLDYVVFFICSLIFNSIKSIFFCQNNLSFMHIFKKNFCSIKKIIDIFKFMLYRYNISIFYIVLHDLRIVINASSQTFQEGERNRVNWIIVSRNHSLETFRKMDEKCRNVPDEPSELRFLIDFVMLPFIFGSFSKSFISFYFSR